MYWDKAPEETQDMWDIFDRLGLDEEDTVTELNRAGMDDLTPVDTMMNANGDYIYVTVL